MNAPAVASAAGAVLVLDERVAGRFNAPADDPIERLMYGFGTLPCLPVGKTEAPRPKPAP